MVLRFLLRNWLHGVAGEKIRKQVSTAARDKIAEMQGTSQAKTARAAGGDDLSADVGIIYALAIEAGGLVDILGSFNTTRGHGFIARRGRLHERSVAVVESGAGGRRAAAATEAVIEACRPRCIISAGFAGGLSPQLQRYDIVLADSLTDAAGDVIGVDLAAIDRDKLPARTHVGRVLSVAEIARRPEEKRSLGERHQAVAVDLESLAVAEVCRRRGVKFLCARVITDSVDEQLPADVQYLTEQPTPAARLGAALGAVCRRPASFKDMWQLKETALVGSDRLGSFLAAVLNQQVLTTE